MSPIKKILHKVWVRTMDLISVFVKVPQPMVFIGPDSSSHLARYIADSGAKHVLLVTDKLLEPLGLHKPLLDIFEAKGVEITVYSKVEPDPTLAQIEEGVKVAQAQNCDTVLAFGGGSSIDAAKVIAAGMTNKMPVSKMGFFNLKKALAPFYAIPTTAGTGSEATIGSVVTDVKNENKYSVVDPKLVPLATALDASLMLGLPARITAATGMDTLTHAVEAFIATRNQPSAKSYGRMAVKLIFDHLRDAYNNGGQLEAREAMAIASHYGGLAISSLGAGYVHGYAHQIGARYHLPHGEINAVLLPLILQESLQEISTELADLAELIGIANSHAGEVENAQAFIHAVESLSADLNMPKGFREIKKEDYETIHRDATSEVFSLYAVPKYMSREDSFRILEAISL